MASGEWRVASKEDPFCDFRSAARSAMSRSEISLSSPGGMIDVRPVGYLIGWLVTALGVSMMLPMVADLATGDSNAQVFATSAILTVLVGVLMALACSRRDRRPLQRQQGFLLTTGIWVVFPLFGRPTIPTSRANMPSSYGPSGAAAWRARGAGAT